MWDIRRRINVERLPSDRVVVRFDLRGVPRTSRGPATWWLVFERPDVDVCPKDPGFSVDVVVEADVAALTKVWMGDLPLAAALRAGLVDLNGPRALVRALPEWLALSWFAGVERPRASPSGPPRTRAD